MLAYADAAPIFEEVDFNNIDLILTEAAIALCRSKWPIACARS